MTHNGDRRGISRFRTLTQPTTTGTREGDAAANHATIDAPVCAGCLSCRPLAEGTDHPARSTDPAAIEAYLRDIEEAEANPQPATPATEEHFRVVMAVTLPANLDADFVWQAVTEAIEAYDGSIGDFECEPV